MTVPRATVNVDIFDAFDTFKQAHGVSDEVVHVFPVRIPPLRERREDILLLVSYFVQRFAKQMEKNIEAIPAAVMKGLTAWDWPGNIRELENFIERAVILTRGRSLEAPLEELHKSNTDQANAWRSGAGSGRPCPIS